MGRVSSPGGHASNQQLPELKENEKNASEVPDWTVDKAEEMFRQQVSSFTCNSQKLQSSLYSEGGKQRLDIKKIKMESK